VAIFVAAAVLAAALLRLTEDGKEAGGNIATPPSKAGASGAGRTVDMQRMRQQTIASYPSNKISVYI
jgi:hypothetical protein